MKKISLGFGLMFALLLAALPVIGQPPQGFGGPGGFGPGGPGGFGPGGFGPGRGGPDGFGRGPGGPGGPREKTKLVKEFDKDENGWLNADERAAARKTMEADSSGRGGPGRGGPGRGGPGRGGPGGRRPGGRGISGEAKPGPQLSPDQVESYPDAELYEPTVLRTLFFEFENEDWERELEIFKNTDVEVPAKLVCDGKEYANVGMRFRGASSYGMVPTGYKRSFNVSIDLADDDQRLYGYKTLNLLNSNGDPSFMSTVLYSHIASQSIPVPKSNHVRVVINGESWGVYVNVQQFDKIFLSEHYESSKGTRWKVSGSPGADGGLRYLGDELDEYKQRFDMKSNDGKKAWTALVKLCKTLNETPLDELENALEPMLDIDETLRFLALDVALVNSDGYWTRASDYSLFLDSEKKFHVIPHDMNEAFHSGRGPGGPRGGPRGPREGDPRGGFGPPGDRDGSGEPRRRESDREGSGRRGPGRGGFDGPGGPGGFGPGGFGGPGGPGGPGGFGGPGGRGPGGPGGRGPGGPGHGGVDLDPLVSIDNPRMPLRSRLLAIPSLRQKYLQYVREIAEVSLDWENVEPIVARHKQLIEEVVATDTRKTDTLEAFQEATSLKDADPAGGRSLRSFFDQRREYLLEYRPPVTP